MEENKEKLSREAENLKNETFETAQKIKESMKDANIKENTKAAKNFVIEMFKNPLEKIKEIAEENSGKYLKIAILFIAIWTILIFIKSTYSTIYYWGFARVWGNILSVLKTILSPVLGIIVYSVIVFVMNKENKKTLTDIISTITITQLPLIFDSAISLLNIISSKISIITSPVISLCQMVAIIFGFFGLKYLFGAKESRIFIKKYIVIQLIYKVCYIIIGLLGIYI